MGSWSVSQPCDTALRSLDRRAVPYPKPFASGSARHQHFPGRHGAGPGFDGPGSGFFDTRSSTTTVADPCADSQLAVIRTRPALRPATSPPPSTVATLVSELVQVTSSRGAPAPDPANFA